MADASCLITFCSNGIIQDKIQKVILILFNDIKLLIPEVIDLLGLRILVDNMFVEKINLIHGSYKYSQ